MQKKGLYKEKIVDHYKNPRNYKKLKDYDYKITRSSATCGDEITIFIKMQEGLVGEVGFQASGCAISVAGMSILSEKIKGMTLTDLNNLSEDFVLGLLGMDSKSPRVGCAILSLKAVKGAINMEEDDPCDFC
ncbi:iron-sulfur cluster assembly scaffold protein [Candidatus Dojkabacteria bacterium]|nr:iron-sulfur cluster assembly scaffold protein [Candidatus Dojkabacteria bacterium]